MVFDRFGAVQIEVRPQAGSTDTSDTASGRDSAGDSSNKVVARNIDNGVCSVVVGDAGTDRRAVACSQCRAEEIVDTVGRQKDADDKVGRIRGGRSFVVFLTAVSFTSGAHGGELCFSTKEGLDHNEALLAT